MKIRKILRKLLRAEYIPLNKMLLEEGIAFNYKPIFDAAGHLSKTKQRMLCKLIVEYIYGYTVTVHNEYAFMEYAVKAFESMQNQQDQDEFDALMHS